jgi:hypothetical protein
MTVEPFSWYAAKVWTNRWANRLLPLENDRL